MTHWAPEIKFVQSCISYVNYKKLHHPKNGNRFPKLNLPDFYIRHRLNQHLTLREKCPFWTFFWSVFSRIRTIRIRKNTDHRNFKYGDFLRSDTIDQARPIKKKGVTKFESVCKIRKCVLFESVYYTFLFHFNSRLAKQ